MRRVPVEGTRRRSAFTSGLVSTAGDGETPHVADDMRAAILAGDEPPGTLIPIDAVARFFGVSQIPVREALKMLLGESLVEHVPHVGYSVAKLTFEEFRELYDIRQALEVAALRVAVRHACASDDQVVRDGHDAMVEALSSSDGRGYSSASRHFHLALMRPSGMRRLLHMYEQAWNMTESAQPMTRVPATDRAELVDDHHRLLDAFIAREADTLVALAIEHYEHIKAAIAALRQDRSLFR